MKPIFPEQQTPNQALPGQKILGMYVANISQSSTDDPTAVVHIDTLSIQPTLGTPVITRLDVGKYQIQFNTEKALVEADTQAYIQMNLGTTTDLFEIHWSDTNKIEIRTSRSGSLTDGLLQKTPIHVTLYNNTLN